MPNRKCPKCGSDRIEAAATVRWSNAAQEWFIRGVDEPNPYCGDCGRDGQGNTVRSIIVEVTLEDEE